jgi:phage host-nuclease inhibitor protein Gam
MIAQDMSRLVGEISDLHAKRSEMMSDLARGSKNLAAEMASFCTHLSEERSNMAKRTKSERMAFVQQLKDGVNAHCRSVANDLAEVRRCWSGKAN